jgi:hypothetical protein
MGILFSLFLTGHSFLTGYSWSLALLLFHDAVPILKDLADNVRFPGRFRFCLVSSLSSLWSCSHIEWVRKQDLPVQVMLVHIVLRLLPPKWLPLEERIRTMLFSHRLSRRQLGQQPLSFKVPQNLLLCLLGSWLSESLRCLLLTAHEIDWPVKFVFFSLPLPIIEKEWPISLQQIQRINSIAIIPDLFHLQL